jgi:hypothetical protein
MTFTLVMFILPLGIIGLVILVVALNRRPPT